MEYNQDLNRKQIPIYCWGHKRLPKQKGINTYTLSANAQRPWAGAVKKGFFNTIRRGKDQVLYVVPPFLVAWWLMDWAEKRNHFLNSKEGRSLDGKNE